MFENKRNGIVFSSEQKLPSSIIDVMRVSGTQVSINLPVGLMVMVLADYNSKDLENFKGPARFRVYCGRNLMIISSKFKGFSFDSVWSPLIARQNGEPDMTKPSATTHMLFNLVLADEHMLVRGIRSATISPDVTMSLWRAWDELSTRGSTPEGFQAEMIELFNEYPREFPETFFHDTCDFGENDSANVNHLLFLPGQSPDPA